MINSFVEEMQLRGYLNQCTDLEKLKKISNKPIIGYIGFDCTANSLHVGSLLQIMVFRLMQKYGHKPIVLLGGGTTLIGDPSGKDQTRKILKEKEINKNITNIKKIFLKLLNFKQKKIKPEFVNNLNWLRSLNYINFLREIGKHFTINKMLTFDSVKLRLEREQSLSYMEFNYMILQAFDFFQLFKKRKCILQIGGSDQWGNIVNGVELIRKLTNQSSLGLTTPLIVTSSGKKMGKTEKGSIWLDKKLISHYDYYQFWRNTNDDDVVKFLKYFTELPVNEIDNLSSKEKNINKLKEILAFETTKILHGKKLAEEAKKTSKETFSGTGVSKNLPLIKLDKRETINGFNLINVLTKNNILSSNNEVRRMIKSRGIKINDEIVSDTSDVNSIKIDLSKPNKISIGKKRHYLIKVY